MRHQAEHRGRAVAGAILAALAVVGLWVLLSEDPAAKDSETGSQASARGATPSPGTVAPLQRPHGPGVEKRAAVPFRSEEHPDGVLEIEVLSGEVPLSGAYVQVYQREPEDPSASPARWIARDGGLTGADGHRVLPVPPGRYFVTARAPELAPGYAAVVHPRGTERTHVRLSLEAGAELAGSTLTQAGGPVPFTELLLMPAAYSSSARELPDGPEEEILVATSSANGAFRFSGLAPGRYRLEARAPGYATAVLPSTPVPFGGRVALLMLPGGQLEGTVLGAEGQPAPEAEVLASNRDLELAARTDTEGHFSLELPSGSYALSARKGQETGALDQEVKLDAGQRVQGLRLQLGAGASVSGRVVREDGSPVEAAGVTARRQGNEKASSLGSTDERGDFSFSSLTAGTYDFQVLMPEGTRFMQGPFKLAAGEQANLTLTYEEPRPGGMRCIVWDGEHPARGVRVRVSPLQPQAAAARTGVEGVTDAEGRILFEGVQPGQYRVALQRGEDSPGADLLVLVSKNETTPCFFQLALEPVRGRMAAVLKGSVLWGSDGPPDEPVMVEITPLDSSPQPRRTLVDEQGRFQLSLHAGHYTLGTLRQHTYRCAAGLRQIQLEQGQTLETTLPLEERAPELRLRILDEDGAPVAWTVMNVQLYASARLAELVQTDAQGRIDICLPPAVPQGIPVPLVKVLSLDSARAAIIDTASGQGELTVRLRRLPSLQGRIIAASGAPVARFTLYTRPVGSWAPDRAHAFVGDRFELLDLPVGPSQLLARADGLQAALLIDLQPGERKVLEIPVYPGVSMRGSVVDAATRQPVGRALISPGLGEEFMTQADGSFVRDDLPAGEFLLGFSTGMKGGRQLVKLPPGQQTDVGDLVIAPR